MTVVICCRVGSSSLSDCTAISRLEFARIRWTGVRNSLDTFFRKSALALVSARASTSSPLLERTNSATAINKKTTAPTVNVSATNDEVGALSMIANL